MPSISAFLPSNVQKHPDRFIAPQLASVLLQAIELGIISNQAMRFWMRAHRETRIIRATALLVLVITLLQTSISFYAIWQLVVYNFGNFLAVVDINWATKTQPLLNGLTAAPVQAVFIWRCWKIMNRNTFVLLPLVLIWCGNITALALVTNYIFTLDTVKLVTEDPGHLPYSFIMWFVLAAALDISLTGIMLSFILRAKSHALSNRAHEILSRSMVTLWETAIPPCAGAIAAMIVYLIRSTDDFWDIFMQDILGKLYVISFFVVLNSRQKSSRDLPLVGSSNPQPSRHSAVISRNNAMRESGSQQIKINMSTTVDTILDPEVESYEMRGERGRRFRRPSSASTGEMTGSTIAAASGWGDKPEKQENRRVSIATVATTRSTGHSI